ncbi:hypothetical protein CQ10_37590 [Bradyrhizobium valentinum]|nr:hypothetical protein CQ10_37590 [Bradyrhizobium valentinum]
MDVAKKVVDIPVMLVMVTKLRDFTECESANDFSIGRRQYRPGGSGTCRKAVTPELLDVSPRCIGPFCRFRAIPLAVNDCNAAIRL